LNPQNVGVKSGFNEQFLPPTMLSNLTVYTFNTHTDTGDSEAYENITKRLDKL